MAAVNITTSYNKCINDIDILTGYLNDCINLDSKYQYFISEVIMLRLFGILENAICEIALKLSCGAVYKNGVLPSTHIKCTTINDATAKMISYNRIKPLRFLKWTKKEDIKDSIKKVLNLSDSFYLNIRTHSLLLDEMRDVRNHIAHRNTGTARKYYEVVRSTYSANIKIPVGAFLISTVRHPMPNIQRYIISTKVILNDITNG